MLNKEKRLKFPIFKLKYLKFEQHPFNIKDLMAQNVIFFVYLKDTVGYHPTHHPLANSPFLTLGITLIHVDMVCVRLMTFNIIMI